MLITMLLLCARVLFVRFSAQIAPVDAVDNADGQDTSGGGGDPAHDVGNQRIRTEGQLASQKQADHGAARAEDLEKASAKQEHAHQQQKSDDKLGDQNAPRDLFGGDGARHRGVHQMKKAEQGTDHGRVPPGRMREPDVRWRMGYTLTYYYSTVFFILQ